ncbi:glycosyltransferase [Azohydromonas caseinilytica]|uniref:Glycosyltransferase n=1 Tax=Azohydromonas caseinilytica TaxID=2728836 RepID=A0A848FAV2_9BURK|nr:glycosyltransferase [Azohydromonas caseinilytica]NML15081.1 glycosyltransferase [Azohydromonas caseinilytica]
MSPQAPSTAAVPDISICVVTYNHEHLIRQCLQSLVDQHTRRSLEIIVGEDCSTDGTRRIVQEFADKYPGIIKPLLHEKNKGMIGNYLSVHRSATGKYICHCDGDDFWEPGKVELQAQFLDNEPDCVAVLSNSYVINEQGERIGVFSEHVRRKFDLAYLIRDGNFLHHSTMMYRAEMRSVMFPPLPEFIDYHIYILLARQGKLGYIDEYLASYRTQSASSVIRNDNERIRRLNWQALAEVKPSDAPLDVIRKADAKFLAGAFYQALRSRRFDLYPKWIELAGQRPGTRSTVPLQLQATALMAGSILGKVAHRLRTKLHAAPASNRVFYPKQP